MDEPAPETQSEETTEQTLAEQPSPARNPLGGNVAFDYLTDVLIPVCILGMVASFTYFLIELRSAYLSGGNQLLKYVFFWFLLAVVCISRLRAKYGGGVVAAPYAAALGAVMVLFVLRFAEWGGSVTGSGGLGGAMLTLFIVALAWWAIHRLTDECTVEEDREDESEEGLLISLQKRQAGGPARRRHPGRLVILFGLVALAVFALTQPIVERSGAELAHRAFLYMVAYLLCALALLSFTSLSGLKLYVRKRGAEMDRFLPPAWLAASVVVVAVILLTAALGPRVVSRSGQLIVQRVAKGFGKSPQNLPVNSPVEGVRAPRGGRVLGRQGEGRDQGVRPQEGAGRQAGQQAPSSSAGAEGKANQTPGNGAQPGAGPGHGEGAGKDTSGIEQQPNQPRSSGRPSEAQSQQQGEAKEGSESPGENEPSNRSSPPAQPPGSRAVTPSSPPESGGQHPSANRSPAAPPAESQNPPSPQTPSASPSPSASPPDLHWLLWAGMAVAALLILYLLARLIPALGRVLRRLFRWRPRFPNPLAAALRRLAVWFRRLLSKKGATSLEDEPVLPADPFVNPFADAALADRLPPGLLVQHTYHALLHYAGLKGCPRRDDQTPLEFLRGLPEGVSHLKDEFTTVTRLYLIAAYTPTELPPSVVGEVRPVWDKLAGLLAPSSE